MKSLEPLLVKIAARRLEMATRIRPLSRLTILAALVGMASGQLVQTQPPTSIHGAVVNSATHEPVPRALVFSPDNRFATLTDSQGRFEFTIPQNQAGSQPDRDSEARPDARTGAIARWIRSGPNLLMARKPGFLQDPSGSAINVQGGPADKDWTITLIPEALIVGKVALANLEPPDSIQLELYRRLVQDGRARWVFMKGASSRSDGSFRFADLPAGAYKLLTRELLDRNPLTADPRGRLFGYPPVYYPAAAGFASAAEIHVAAGETVQAALTLIRQPYYNVRIPVVDGPAGGLAVTVYVVGNRGPGYALGYNARDQAIEGLLPNGTFTVEATSYLPNNAVAAASVNLTIHDGVASGPPLALSMGATIPVLVREEFTQKWGEDVAVGMADGRRFRLTGPRRYLNLMLEPEDDFGGGRGATLRAPGGSSDQSLAVESVLPGRYWLRATTSRGFVASARSGNTDLLHQPLIVGEGGAPSPIEITLRDETAEIDGTVEGISSSLGTAADSSFVGPGGYSAAPAHVYCVPLAESSGAFTEVGVAPDGTFQSPPLAPGAYRVLAFARPHSDLEYQNPEAMQAYDSKGPVVRVSAGQKESVRLQLISEE